MYSLNIWLEYRVLLHSSTSTSRVPEVASTSTPKVVLEYECSTRVLHHCLLQTFVRRLRSNSRSHSYVSPVVWQSWAQNRIRSGARYTKIRITSYKLRGQEWSRDNGAKNVSKKTIACLSFIM